jgi:hypothetical protein
MMSKPKAGIHGTVLVPSASRPRAIRFRVAVAVGIPVTRHPPHRSVRALISAYGS